MSLILDALRKADAERERGSVPSLHSHPVVPSSSVKAPRAQARPNWLWIAVGVAVGLACAATWVMVARDTPQPKAAAGNPVPATAAAPATPAVPPAATANSPPAATAPGNGAPQSPASAPADAQPIAEPAPWRQPEERKPARGDGRDAAQVAQPAAPAAADTTVYSREQLPQNIRSELPQFAIGGSIYSPVPASRSLIVNGQLYRERDRLTQDLSLDEIKLKSAIFSFRGYRFEVMF